MCDLGSSTHKFKDIYLSGNNLVGLPYNLIFAGIDEITNINTIGQKLELRVPQNFTTSKIKISVNQGGGIGFAVSIKKNNVTVITIAQENFLISNAVSVESYLEDDNISIEVENVGSGTAVGLKCYLIGKTD